MTNHQQYLINLYLDASETEPVKRTSRQNKYNRNVQNTRTSCGDGKK